MKKLNADDDKFNYSGRLLKSEWVVKDVDLSVARIIIESNHYAKGGSNTRVYTHGLFRRDDPAKCRGVAWWIPPTKSAALKTYPSNWKGVLSLSRLAVDPECPKNSCSYLISKSIKMIDRSKWPCLVTYADDWQGHAGTIYKATGWTYVGKTKPERTWLMNGVMVSRKAGPKTRTKSEMMEIGATCIGSYSKHKFVMIMGENMKNKDGPEAAKLRAWFEDQRLNHGLIQLRPMLTGHPDSTVESVCREINEALAAPDVEDRKIF